MLSETKYRPGEREIDLIFASNLSDESCPLLRNTFLPDRLIIEITRIFLFLIHEFKSLSIGS